MIVANLRDSVVTEEQGDLFEPMEKGLVKLEDIHDLGELATGDYAGRTDANQISYHKNNNGTGVSEMALAMLAYRLAKEAGRGLEIDLDRGSA